MPVSNNMKKTLATILILAPLLMPFAAHADITSNLLSWYKFDEGSGSTAIDSGSVGNNGTEVNGPTYVTGKIGPFALSFNNSFNQRVETSNASSYNFTSGGFTVSSWVKASSADSCDTIATTLVPPSYQGWEYAISQGSCSAQPGIPSVYNGSTWISDNHTVNDNTWHMLTVVFDPTGLGAYKFYDNGTLSATDVAGAPSYGATPLWIAGRNDGGAPQYMLGVMDDVRVYNRTLSAADVAELYLYPPPAVLFNSFMVKLGSLFRVFKGAGIKIN